MTFLVVSDSHRDHLTVRRLLETYGTGIGAAIHLGDYADDLARYRGEFPGIDFYAVAGNGERFLGPPGVFGGAEFETDVNGARILLLHGHAQSVKMGYDRLIYYAMERGASACLFGHTHVPALFENGPILFMNPGSLGRPRPGGRPGYGLLRVSDSGVASGSLHNL
jgi:putative phosphoesterase